MKTDKTKLLQDIEATKEKLASMEKELNKTEEFKHFPSEDDKYYYYTSAGVLCNNYAGNDNLKVNVFKTEKEAVKAYNKDVALEKVKRRLVELQGDWRPYWLDECEVKYHIKYNHSLGSFKPTDGWLMVQYNTSIPFMKNKQIANTIIVEMEDELKLIFDIA